MNKKTSLYCFTVISLAFFVVIGVSSCALMSAMGLSSGKWKDVSYSGETDSKVLEGNIWNYANKSWPAGREPLEVEFQPNGKLISSNNWRNATWERVGNNVRIVLENGQNHIEGTLSPDNNTISGTIFNSDDTSSEILMQFVINSSNITSRTYNIGDRGPAGGIIFYDKGNNLLGWRYMEAAPTDLPNAQWGLLGIDARGVTTGGTSMGVGKRNTEILVDYLTRNNENRRAAQLCADYSLNGYDDWFLPSYDELLYLYNNLRKKGVGNFKNDLYWSSSQLQAGMMSMGTHNAFAKDFNISTSPAYLGSYGKDMPNSVRAVRLVTVR